MKNNLLLALHKWAEDRRQDENFTTEVFAYMLKHWIWAEPSFGRGVLSKLISDFLKLTDTDCSELDAITQRRVDGNQPDIRIETRDARDLQIIVEVKVREPVNWLQIKGYSDELRDSGCTRTCLVLLTRDLPFLEGHPEAALVGSYVRWHGVAEHIRRELKGNRIGDPVSKYLADQLLEFLKARRITMEKVGSDLVGGVRSLENLIVMLEETIKKKSDKAGWQPKTKYMEGGWSGVYFGPNNSYWCGVSHDDGGSLVFQAYGRAKHTTNPIGGWEWIREGKREREEDVLRYKLRLNGDGFFEGNADAQYDQIDKFVSDRLRELGNH